MKRVAACLSMCVACDGIGAPVVSDVTLPDISIEACSSSLLSCAVPFPSFEPVHPLPVDDRECRLTAPTSTLVIDEKTVTGSVARCGKVELDLTHHDGTVTWAPGTLALSTLQVVADRPVRLSVTASSIVGSAITLVGPIELSLSAASISETAFASGTGEAALALADTQGTNLVLGSAHARFARVDVAGSTLQNGALWAEQLTFTTSSLTHATLDASSLLAVDDVLTEVEVRGGTGRIAGSKATRLYIARCSQLQLTGSLCEACLLRGCEDADLLVTTGQTTRSAVLGNVTFVDGTIRHSVIGQDLEQPTRVRMYGVEYALGEVCAGATGIGFESTRPVCIACRDARLDDPSTTCKAERSTNDEPGVARDSEPASDYDDPRYDVLTSYANPQCPPFGALPACGDFPPSPRPY